MFLRKYNIDTLFLVYIQCIYYDYYNENFDKLKAYLLKCDIEKYQFFFNEKNYFKKNINCNYYNYFLDKINNIEFFKKTLSNSVIKKFNIINFTYDGYIYYDDITIDDYIYNIFIKNDMDKILLSNEWPIFKYIDNKQKIEKTIEIILER